MKTNNKGFSLVELIVVIAIMAILAAVAIPTFASFITKAQDASGVQEVADLVYAAKLACVEFKCTVKDADVASDCKTITITFDGEKAAKAADQAASVVEGAVAQNGVVTLTLDKALSDKEGVEKAEDTLKELPFTPADPTPADSTPADPTPADPNPANPS